LKKYEKIALLKFMSIYMVSLFILFLMLSIMYYYDQKNNLKKEVQDEMIAYISLSRGNNKIQNNNFNLEIKPSKHYQYPTFYEKDNTFISVTCASKYQLNKVFVVTADKKIIDKKITAIIFKISIIMLITFFIFLLVGYFLARMSIEPLEESRKMINKVIEDILHDLNAPMSAISINCEGLNETISSQKDKSKVDRIMKSNKTIKFLYNNLSALVDHTISPKYESVNISNIIKDRVEFYSDLSPEVKFNLSLAPLIIELNYDSLERILDNLLSNAIKYSQPNPNITIKIYENSIIIEDNGVGIKNCSNIFNRYYREKNTIDKACGLGLGLSIVKRLCAEMNITIKYKDVTHGGSQFTLDFQSLSVK